VYSEEDAAFATGRREEEVARRSDIALGDELDDLLGELEGEAA